MKREEEIFKLYNEIDELIDSVSFDDKKQKINNDYGSNIPEMTKVVFDNNNITKYKEKTKEEKELIKNIKKEETIKLSEEIKNELDGLETKKQEKINSKEKSKVKKERKKNKKNKIKKWVITFGVLDLIAIICLFLMYGPISYFRNLWVTSAMSTMTHQYLAYIFFNQQQIDKIMSNNVVIEVDEDTNKEEIDFKQEEIVEYSSIYEEQVLKKEEGNDLYKVIEIEGDNYKGHLLVVYDASKIQLAEIANYKYGQTIEQFVKKNNAVAGINAGGFVYSEYKGYTPTGTVIIDGKVKFNNGGTGWGGGIVGFTNDNVLVLTKASANQALQMGIRDAVSFGPFLVVNGVASQFKGNGGYGIAPRTAIGQRKDGIVLLLVIDGRRPGHSLGVDMVELTNIMLRYGAYNASNLDGGGSSSIVVEGKTLSVAGGSGYSGERYLPNSWLVIP